MAGWEAARGNAGCHVKEMRLVQREIGELRKNEEGAGCLAKEMFLLQGGIREGKGERAGCHSKESSLLEVGISEVREREGAGCCWKEASAESRCAEEGESWLPCERDVKVERGKPQPWHMFDSAWVRTT